MSRSTKILAVTLILLIDFLASLYVFIYQPEWLLEKLQFGNFTQSIPFINNQNKVNINQLISPNVKTEGSTKSTGYISDNKISNNQITPTQFQEYSCNLILPDDYKFKLFLLSKENLENIAGTQDLLFEIPNNLVTLTQSSSNLTIKFPIPKNIVQGNYKARLDIFNSNLEIVSGCASKSFFINNNFQGILVGKITEPNSENNLFPYISDLNSKLSFQIFSTKNYDVIKPKIVIKDYIINDDREILFKTIPEIKNIEERKPITITLNLPEKINSDIYQIELEIYDSNNQKVSLSPTYLINFKNNTSINDITYSILENNTFKINISYNSSPSAKPKQVMQIKLKNNDNVILAQKEYFLKEGWPSSIELPVPSNTKISILDILLKDIRFPGLNIYQSQKII